MDKLRARFEKRYRELMHDEYISDKEWAWKFYEASLADVEIALPKPEEVTGKFVMSGRLWSLGEAWKVYDSQDVNHAIRAAGIKVKE